MIVLAPNNCLKRAYETPCKQIILEFEEKGNHPFTSNKQASRRNEQSLSLTRTRAWIEKKKKNPFCRANGFTYARREKAKQKHNWNYFFLL